jgi:hypothetical protein
LAERLENLLVYDSPASLTKGWPHVDDLIEPSTKQILRPASRRSFGRIANLP